MQKWGAMSVCLSSCLYPYPSMPAYHNGCDCSSVCYQQCAEIHSAAQVRAAVKQSARVEDTIEDEIVEGEKVHSVSDDVVAVAVVVVVVVCHR